MGWTFTLFNPAIGDVVGEIPNCVERRLTLPLSRPDSASFKIPLDNRFADRILECKDFVVVNDGRGECMFHGPIVTAEEVGEDEQTVAVTVASPFWWLDRRLLGRSTAGLEFSAASAENVLTEILLEANIDANTYIGEHAPVAGVATVAGPWHYKPASEAILEVSSSLGGPDWWLTYLDPGASHSYGPKVADWQHAGQRGADRSGEVFLEYGTGKLNLAGYKRAVSRDGLLTRAFGLPPGFPDGVEPVSTAVDATLEADYGVGYGVVPNDLVAAAIRTELLESHVAIRKQPRQVITLTPYRESSPQIKGPSGAGDYEVGDLVTGRAVERGRLRFDATFRVYQVAFDIDDLGDATPTIDVIPNYT